MAGGLSGQAASGRFTGAIPLLNWVGLGIMALVLDGAAYRVHGEFPCGTTATSVLLPTFAVEVTAVFDAGSGRESTM